MAGSRPTLPSRSADSSPEIVAFDAKPAAPQASVAKALPKAPEIKAAPKLPVTEPISAAEAEAFTNLGHYSQSDSSPTKRPTLFTPRKPKVGRKKAADPQGKGKERALDPAEAVVHEQELDQRPPRVASVDIEAGLARQQAKEEEPEPLPRGLPTRNYGEMGSEGGTVLFPSKEGITAASWTTYPRNVPDKYEPNPSSDIQKVSKKRQKFKNDFVAIMRVVQNDGKFWDTTGFVTALLSAFLTFLIGIRFIYKESTQKSYEMSLNFNATYNETAPRPYTRSDLIFYTFMDAAALFIGFVSFCVALYARYARNNANEVLAQGRESLAEIGEPTLALKFAPR